VPPQQMHRLRLRSPRPPLHRRLAKATPQWSRGQLSASRNRASMQPPLTTGLQATLLSIAETAQPETLSRSIQAPCTQRTQLSVANSHLL
jgi:hypothetical protein